MAISGLISPGSTLPPQNSFTFEWTKRKKTGSERANDCNQRKVVWISVSVEFLTDTTHSGLKNQVCVCAARAQLVQVTGLLPMVRVG